MKNVILMRHTKTDETSTKPNARIPLSEEGIERAKAFFQRSEFANVSNVSASNYKRAYQTAHIIAAAVLIDSRLAERRVGDMKTPEADFWKKQYLEPDFRNEGGESLREAGERVAEFVNELLSGMRDGETELIVSHAAAICGYLMKYCRISVTDAEKKLRRIEFDGNVILDGRIETPGAFVLSFEGGELKAIRYIE